MATILTFRPAAPEPDAGDSAPRATTTAEVIVFPGVRYEHWDDAAGDGDTQSQERAKAKLKRNRTRRDFLEFAE